MNFEFAVLKYCYWACYSLGGWVKYCFGVLLEIWAALVGVFSKLILFVLLNIELNYVSTISCTLFTSWSKSFSFNFSFSFASSY
jgi:hypothetical protein